MAKFSSTIFHHLNEVDDIKLPKRFTFPFYYEPHELCIRASQEVQDYLESQSDFNHNFGLDPNKSGLVIGKMFGVMIVQDQFLNLGYLCAFSGKLAESNSLGGFVPPVYDTLDINGFYKKGEKELNEINNQIDELESSKEVIEAKEKLFSLKTENKNQLIKLKKRLKYLKVERNRKRQEAAINMDEHSLKKYNTTLDQESIQSHFELRDFKQFWSSKIDKAKQQLALLESPIINLKESRKQKSSALQHKLHQQYRFLNALNESKDLIDIFDQTALKIPPAGAGECSAPKLFQYAYSNGLNPIAMAEFWWGASPKSEIRKHKQFYPSCKSKCEPILTHMMKGLQVDSNPILEPIKDVELEIMYEDDHIVLINKPHEFLSVPGRHIRLSVLSKMKTYLPKATGPLLLHRLDMSTSGLLLVAKDQSSHFHLQQQFIKRQIKKSYVAILEGKINSDEGIIDLPLILDYNNRPRQMVSFEKGKSAQTRFKVLSQSNGQTRIRFFPITGRTHQLRVHAAHHLGLNCPILGDDLYGNKSDRLYLHAEELKFVHPHTNKLFCIKCEAPF